MSADDLEDVGEWEPDRKYHIVVYGDGARRLDEAWKTAVKADAYRLIAKKGEGMWRLLQVCVTCKLQGRTFYLYWNEMKNRLEVCVNSKRKRTKPVETLEWFKKFSKKPKK
jgi:hypothetical protein